MDAGGFALGASAGAGAGAAEAAGAGAGFAGASDFAEDVEGFGGVLENITSCLYVVHGVNGFAANADFVMQMGTCAASG